MVYTRTGIALPVSLLFFLPLSVSAVPQNNTVDDSDQIAINYWTAADWSHDPLAGYEQFFFNGTRSYTYVPGAAAFFNFTGTGIYLQGPYANDQALRSVTLDGQDMGTFAAYAPQRLPTEGSSSIFWGRGGLPNTLHIVAVAHADTADKILAMDAWIYESDYSQSPQCTETSTTYAFVSSPSSSSSSSSPSSSPTTSNANAQVTGSSSHPTTSNMGFVIGIAVPLLLLLLCGAGYCVFSRRLQRNAKRQHDTMRERTLTSPLRSPMRLTQPIYPASATLGPTPFYWRSATGTSVLDYPSSGLNAEQTSAGAVVPGGGEALPSRPFHDHPRAASDAYNNGDSLGLSNHPAFVPIPITSDSSNPHYPIPQSHARAPMWFFEQRPDPVPPLNSDYAPQPLVNAPMTSPSFFRRLSATISGVVPGLAPIRSLSRSSAGGERRVSVLSDFRYHTITSPRASMNANRALDIEPTASPQSRERERDAYLPYPSSHHLPSSPNSASIPLSSSPAVSIGSACQPANLEKLEDLKDEKANLSTVDTLHTLNMGARSPHSDDVKVGELSVDGGRGVERKRGSITNPFDNDFTFSSYTPLTKDEVIALSQLALSA